MSNFVPWRGPAWALLAERSAVLADRCEQLSGRPEVPAAVTAAAQRARSITDRLAADVPSELRPV